MTIQELINQMKKNNRHFISLDSPIFISTMDVYDIKIGIMWGSRICAIDDYNLMCQLVDGVQLDMQSNINRLYNAITINYNPIENYDKNSTITTTDSGSEKNVETPQGSIVNATDIGAQESTFLNQTPTDDSQDFLNSDKATNNTSERKDTQVTTYDEYSITNQKTFENRQNEVVEHTHGNIGVTRAQEMINDEIKMRLRNFVNDVLFAIIKEVSY